jgi:hypothetical protein
VKAYPGTTIAGWIEKMEYTDDHAGSSRDEHEEPDMHAPGIVLNQYGRGKTVFFAFDLGTALKDDSRGQEDDKLPDLVRNALSYIHTKADSPRPGFLVPVDLTFRSHGGPFDLRVSRTYSRQLRLLDPAVHSWVPSNPWLTRLRIGHGESKLMRYYVLMPDQGGTFTIRTDTENLATGRPGLFGTVLSEFTVAADLRTTASQILNQLQALDPSNNYAVSMAIQSVVSLQKRTVMTKKEIAQNIRDILTAIAWLLQAEMEIDDIRLKLDELLKGWVSRYYLEAAER